MRYYEVFVGDGQFHGNKPLTYAWEEPLKRGQIVRVSLKNRSVLGIISSEVTAPIFATKSIAAIAPAPPVPERSLDFLTWLSSYYPAPSGLIVRLFLPPVAAFPKKLEPYKAPVAKPAVQLPLTAAQQTVLKTIAGPGSYLLHGVTGSGKTRIYLELAKRTLADGKSVIVLTPEIGLTAPLVDQFSELGYPVLVFHSNMTAATRRDVWYAALSTNPCIVIGPRSALFTPCPHIGLIVMDEAHDQAYKSDAAPHYRTDRIAARLAQLHQAVFLLGTATPNIEDMYAFTEKARPIITLDKPALAGATPPKIHTVDLRDKTQFGRSRILTTPLLSEIKDTLQRGEQSLLFLNRRGTASAVLCESCGWRAYCNHCDLPFTYHADAHHLRCHVCGRRSSVPTACPECGETKILLRSIGTKAVVEELERLFPTARIKRFDTDAERSEHIEHQLQTLQNGDVDIIVGTQMIAKGLDLTRLSLVGVINADSGLLIPDYNAGERTYQLLHQVIGRVGRGHRDSVVIVQTYEPDHPILQAAIRKDWRSFYEREIAERKAYIFPPFCYLLKLSCLRAGSASAEKAAHTLLSILEKNFSGITIEGPSPSFHPKESGKYKWQLLLKSPSRQTLLGVIEALPSGWTYDIDPIHIL